MKRFLSFITLMLAVGMLSAQTPEKSDVAASDSPKVLLGINGGAGYLYASHYTATVGSGGLDLAFRIKDSFAMGLYGTYRSMNAVNFGPLFIMGPLNKSSFLLGFGPELLLERHVSNLEQGTMAYSRTLLPSYGCNLKLGARHKGFYWFFSVSADYLQGNDIAGQSTYDWQEMSYAATFNIGWMFGIRNK